MYLYSEKQPRLLLKSEPTAAPALGDLAKSSPPSDSSAMSFICRKSKKDEATRITRVSHRGTTYMMVHDGGSFLVLQLDQKANI